MTDIKILQDNLEGYLEKVMKCNVAVLDLSISSRRLRVLAEVKNRKRKYRRSFAFNAKDSNVDWNRLIFG